MVQFSLQAMLELAQRGHFTRTKVVEKMCHAPATLFGIDRRGYIRKGYFADITIIDPNKPYTVTSDKIVSRCKWSPFEGHTFPHSITHTIVNGNIAFENGNINENCRGELLTFIR